MTHLLFSTFPVNACATFVRKDTSIASDGYSDIPMRSESFILSEHGDG